MVVHCYSVGDFNPKMDRDVAYIVSGILHSLGCVTLSRRYYSETYLMLLLEPELIVPEPEEIC